MTQESAATYLRHGMTPFFRLPLAPVEALDCASKTKSDSEPDSESDSKYDSKSDTESDSDIDAMLLGVPWDGGVTYRPGARFAPYALRRVSALLQTYHPVHQLDVFRRLRVVDGGNVPLAPFDPVAARAAIEGATRAIVERGACPVVVGGDHSLTLPVLRAVAGRHGPVAVIHIDAHLDTSTAATWGEPIHHGTVIRNACDEGWIARGALYQLGIRATWAGADDGDYARDHGGGRYSVDDLAGAGARDLGKTLARALGERPVYVSFDIDAIDPAFAPGTGTPVPGGISAREALAFLRGLAGIRLVGFDLVEVCPDLDHAEITLHLGAAILYEALALAACAKRAKCAV